MEKNPSQILLVIVTGYSGAGKSTVINALEDLSFYCIDNLPLGLLEDTVHFFLEQMPGKYRFALGIDVRSGNFSEKFLNIQEKVTSKIHMDTVFLTCSRQSLISRFSTTRRRHPLTENHESLHQALAIESESLREVEEKSDVIFDTTNWSPHFLARQVEKRFLDFEQGRNLHVSVTSFGFKYGAPESSDMIFDVRFLNNPHFKEELRKFTGLNQRVRDFIFEDERTQAFIDRLENLHGFLLPCYYNEGKHYLRIGIGCTGGKHRSVVIAESLTHAITQLNVPKVSISVVHRDISRSKLSPM